MMSTDTQNSIERYLSTAELMAMLGISRSTVRRLRLRGMPHLMVGAVHRFPKDQVLTCLKGTEKDAKQTI
jgi:excisionase family DNA binding protein